MLDISFCYESVKNLHKHGLQAMLVYETICEGYIFTYGMPQEFCFEGCSRCLKIFPILDLLEKEGYILTTEKDKDFLFVKPNGLYVRDYNDFVFCKSGCCLKA